MKKPISLLLCLLLCSCEGMQSIEYADGTSVKNRGGFLSKKNKSGVIVKHDADEIRTITSGYEGTSVANNLMATITAIQGFIQMGKVFLARETTKQVGATTAAGVQKAQIGATAAGEAAKTNAGTTEAGIGAGLFKKEGATFTQPPPAN